MYRSVLALLFASVLLLSGCAAERQRIPREKDTQGTDMAGQSPGGDGAVLQASHRSGRLPEARGGDHPGICRCLFAAENGARIIPLSVFDGAGAIRVDG